MEKVLKKSYKILGLSLVILAVSIFAFFNRGKEGVKNFQVAPLSPGFGIGGEIFMPNDSSRNLPDPKKFSFFTYGLGGYLEKNELEIEAKCGNVYSTVLIFSSVDDYRQNPGSAKFNRATPCKLGENIKHKIDLTILNLTPGRYYYFVADQGEKDTWYNPK